MLFFTRFPDLFSSKPMVVVFLLLLMYLLKPCQIQLQIGFDFPNHKLAQLGNCLYTLSVLPCFHLSYASFSHI